jgi:hypothetical protein
LEVIRAYEIERIEILKSTDRMRVPVPESHDKTGNQGIVNPLQGGSLLNFRDAKNPAIRLPKAHVFRLTVPHSLGNGLRMTEL